MSLTCSATMKIQAFESLGQYHDSWATIILCAPDRFPEYTWDTPPRSQAQRLEEAFASLREGIHFAEKRLKVPRLVGVFRELLKMSHEAYLDSDGKRGAHVLQEAEGLVWPSRASRLKYVVEAERRAFGDVALFKDVVVSPYPYEGCEADLGKIQRELWRHASAEMNTVAPDGVSMTRTWAADADGAIRIIGGRSRKAILLALSEGAAQGRFLGYAMASLIGQDLLCVDVEEHGKPHISVRRLVKPNQDPLPRFHLDEPQIFTKAVA